MALPTLPISYLIPLTRTSQTKQCSHLIVSNGTQSSKKVEYAVKWKLAVLNADWLYKVDAGNAWVEERVYAVFGGVVEEENETQTVLVEQTGAVEPSKSVVVRKIGDEMKSFEARVEQSEEIATQALEGLFSGIHFYCVGFNQEFVSEGTS
jgi:hypothetical protein